MGSKMAKTRFTIQFSQTDPTHLQVAELLNKQGRRSKAQYIVNAVLHFENCQRTPSMQNPASLDEKQIEAIVNRVLLEKEKSNSKKSKMPKPNVQLKNRPETTEKINFNDDLDALDNEDFDTLAGTLKLFRNK
jgi:hypothetical protein